MALQTFSFISGLTGLANVIVGTLMGIYLLFIYNKSKSKATLALSITLISISAVWLGVALNFILYLMHLDFLTFEIYFAIIAWPIAIAIPSSLYLTTCFLFEAKQKYIVSVAVLIGVLYLIIVYVLTPLNIIDINTIFKVEYPSEPIETLPDSSFKGIVLILTFTGIFTLLISGLLFLITGIRSDISLASLRGKLMGSGFILFSVMSIFDAVSETLNSEVFLFFVRLLIILSFFLTFLGITTPKRLFGNKTE